VQLRVNYEINRQLQRDSGLSLADYHVMNAFGGFDIPRRNRRYTDHDHQWRRCSSFLKAVRRGDSFNAKARTGGATSRTRLHHSIAIGQSKPKTTLTTPCHRVPPGSVWVRQNHQPTTTPIPV
jgi:hypothetical protein